MCGRNCKTFNNVYYFTRSEENLIFCNDSSSISAGGRFRDDKIIQDLFSSRSYYLDHFELSLTQLLSRTIHQSH